MDANIPTAAAILLDFIGDIEAPKGYDTIFGNRQNRLAKPITKMTLDEVMAHQRNWSSKRWVAQHWGYKSASSASGRYQFMLDTLRDLKIELKLSGREIFNADFQDRLGFHLLKRRGYLAYMSNQISRTVFGLRLAQEWASLPVLSNCRGAHREISRGDSYYRGDELNKSLVSPVTVEAVLDRVRRAPGIAEPSVPVVETLPAAPAKGWSRFAAAFGTVVGRLIGRA